MLHFEVIVSPLSIYLAKFKEKRKFFTANLEMPHVNFLVSGLKVRLGQLNVLLYNQVHKKELLHLHFNSGGTLYGQIFFSFFSLSSILKSLFRSTFFCT